jgi:hypothetical protein
MLRSISLFIFALGLLGGNASAATIYTLPDEYVVFDSGAYGGNAYASGRIAGMAGANQFLFNLTTSSQVSISVPQYEGVDARAANVTSVDWPSGTAWLSISYGVGIGSRTGSVPITGGTVTLNQFTSTGGSGSTVVNAAAGGYGFGENLGRPVVAQPSGFWSELVARAGTILDAVFTPSGDTVAVGGIDNGFSTNAVVFTNLTLTLEHDCGDAFCFLWSVSNDGLWGGLTFNDQVGLLDLTTNTRYLLGEGVLDLNLGGVLGGANPVLFYQSSTGPRAWSLGGADQSYADWYLAVNGVPLGFVPTGVGDARVLAGQVYQSVFGSTHVANYIDPGRGPEAVPELSTWVMLLTGSCGLFWFARRSKVRCV